MHTCYFCFLSIVCGLVTMEKHIFRTVSAGRGWHFYKRAFLCSFPTHRHTHTCAHTHIVLRQSPTPHSSRQHVLHMHATRTCAHVCRLQRGSRINSCWAECSAQLKLYASHTLKGGPFLFHTHFNSPPQYPGTNYNHSTEGLYVWYPFCVCVCVSSVASSLFHVLVYLCHITIMEAYH